MNPKTISYGTKEYKNLEAVAKILEALSPNRARYEVENVYFDIGQDWMWTTIVRYEYRECQILTPREWAEILMATTPKDFADVVEDIRNGKWFADKEEM